MSRTLSPLGTARERFLSARGRRVEASAAEPSIPDELRAGCEGFDLDELLLARAWELVRCAPQATPAEQRTLFFLVTAALANERRGGTRLPLVEGGPFDRMLAAFGAPEEAARARALLAAPSGPGRALVGLPGEHKPLVVEDRQLSFQRTQLLEDRLGALLLSRLNGGGRALDARRVQAALADLRGRPPAPAGKAIELSAEQERAIRLALFAPLALITGGPGTGKTSIVVSILRMLARLGTPPERVALAAPTGKAANRMGESIRAYLSSLRQPSDVDRALAQQPPEPRTLHRLLAYSPSRDLFLHHAGNPLAAEVVLVDESSMIDLRLMDSLLRAVRPDARLVLLGDGNQLPSVDSGTVFRDLVAASPRQDASAPGGGGDPRAGSVVALEHSYRMDPSDPDGRSILLAARLINEGRSEQLLSGPQAAARRDEAEALEFHGAEWLAAGASALDRFLDRWMDKVVRASPDLIPLARRQWVFEGGAVVAEQAPDLARLFALSGAARVLCVTREPLGGTGSDAVNVALGRLWADAAFRGHGQARLLPGEPVMMERNDYSLGLFNGDQGLVLQLEEDGKPAVRAVFPTRDGYRAYPLGALGPVPARAWALSVHKAQGSEHDRVAVILPSADLPLLTRELLYTAFTRARRGAVVVGSEALLRTGVERKLERHSGLQARLTA